MVGKFAALTGALAIINQAAALNIHRRDHLLEKKQDVVYETVMETVLVYADQPATPAGDHEDPAPTGLNNNNNNNKPASAPPAVVPAPAPVPAAAVTPVTSGSTGSKGSTGSGSTGSGSGSGSSSTTPSGSTVSKGNTGSTGNNGVGVSFNSSSNGLGCSGKRGIAYDDPALANVVASACKNGACCWGYNWNQEPRGFNPDLAFIPMVWGPTRAQGWADTASKAIANGAKALFSINEPDILTQASMSPADAAAFHIKSMNPFYGKTLISAPAVSNSNLQGQGLQWLKSWVAECQTLGCKYDFCNLHFYNKVDAIENLFDTLEQAREICGGKPLWLTEFAPVEASPEQAADFLAKVIPRLDKLDYLHAYAYFMANTEQLHLLSSPTALSSIGKVYVS